MLNCNSNEKNVSKEEKRTTALKLCRRLKTIINRTESVQETFSNINCVNRAEIEHFLQINLKFKYGFLVTLTSNVPMYYS